MPAVHACGQIAISLASFPGSPEREINTRGKPGMFFHVIMT